MQLTDWNSRLLKTAAYQSELAVLELVFRSGEVYHYFGVPAEIYQELRWAESKGGYFNSHLRNRFPYSKVHSGGAPRTDEMTL